MKKKRGIRVLIALTFFLLLTGTTAVMEETSEVLTIPADVTVIEEEAFLNCAEVTEVVLPESLLRIEASAFAGTGLTEISIPDSVEYVAPDAFPEGTVIWGKKDSYAQTWAQTNGYPFNETGTHYYALLIGQTYEGSKVKPYLLGCRNDVVGFGKMLNTMTGTPYTVVERNELKSTEILGAIRDAFGQADADDVCLFYYTGHGNSSTETGQTGALIGTDGMSVVLGQIRSTLDAIPGDKVIILDSCYSGNMITNAKSVSGTKAEVDLDAVNRSVINAFTAPRNAKAATVSGKYYVLTASSDQEESFCITVDANGKECGAFTYALLEGCGYSIPSDKVLGMLFADTNRNRMIDLNEAFTYAYETTDGIMKSFQQQDPSIIVQHVQAYPTGSSFVLWGR